MSGIVDDLVKMLKRAEREAAKAQRAFDAAHAQSRELLKALETSRRRTREIDRAIAILQQHLRPEPEVETGNVTKLHQ